MAESQENVDRRVNEFWDLLGDEFSKDYARLVDDTLKDYVGRITNLDNEEIDALINTPRGRFEKAKFEGTLSPLARDVISESAKPLIRKIIETVKLIPEDSDQKHEEQKNALPLQIFSARPPGLTEAQWIMTQAERDLDDMDKADRDREIQRRLNAPLRGPLDALFSEFAKGSRGGPRSGRGRPMIGGMFYKKRHFTDSKNMRGSY